jgi:hypothetical protein
MIVNWPDDADGGALRRLLEYGLDFNKPHEIEFQVEFEKWPPSQRALALLKSEFPNVIVYEPEANSAGYVQFTIQDRVTYELVTAIQNKVSLLLRPYGGRCDAWGILH